MPRGGEPPSGGQCGPSNGGGRVVGKSSSECVTGAIVFAPCARTLSVAMT